MVRSLGNVAEGFNSAYLHKLYQGLLTCAALKQLNSKSVFTWMQISLGNSVRSFACTFMSFHICEQVPGPAKHRRYTVDSLQSPRPGEAACEPGVLGYL